MSSCNQNRSSVTGLEEIPTIASTTENPDGCFNWCTEKKGSEIYFYGNTSVAAQYWPYPIDSYKPVKQALRSVRGRIFFKSVDNHFVLHWQRCGNWRLYIYIYICNAAMRTCVHSKCYTVENDRNQPWIGPQLSFYVSAQAHLNAWGLGT